MKSSSMRRTALALAALFAASLFAMPAVAQGPSGGTLRVGTTGNKSELVKTVPIGRKKRSKPRVVMSLPPGNLGELRRGDRLEATGEVEVSVCLKPNRNHGSQRSCVGRTYGYDPQVVAELVLADGSQATGGPSIVRLGRKKVTCTQRQPHRNHHCVIVIDDGALDVASASKLPCNPTTCHVNMIVSANHRKAKSGHKLVIGAASDGNRVKGDKGRINIARYRPGGQDRVSPTVTRARKVKRIPIVARGREPKRKVLYSVALPNLRHGEQLVVDARAIAKIGRHPYNVFQTSQLILSENPKSDSKVGWSTKVSGDLNGQVSEGNGFNCTQGRSAHANPCTVRKVGVVEITRDSPKTLYLNLVSGIAVQLGHERHRTGDKAKLTKKGFLRVYRYPPDRNDSPPPARD